MASFKSEINKLRPRKKDRVIENIVSADWLSHFSSLHSVNLKWFQETHWSWIVTMS